MSRKLALSSALSILLMAGFALCGPGALTSRSDGGSPFAAPAKVQMQGAPSLPGLPGLH